MYSRFSPRLGSPIALLAALLTGLTAAPASANDLGVSPAPHSSTGADGCTTSDAGGSCTWETLPPDMNSRVVEFTVPEGVHELQFAMKAASLGCLPPQGCYWYGDTLAGVLGVGPGEVLTLNLHSRVASDGSTEIRLAPMAADAVPIVLAYARGWKSEIASFGPEGSVVGQSTTQVPSIHFEWTTNSKPQVGASAPLVE